jgi:hypothetical protein
MAGDYYYLLKTLKMDLFSQLKKSVASVAFVAMAFTIFAPVASAMLPFTDAAEIPSWAEEAVEELMDQGVLSGNDDGSFAPNRQLNRAEVSKIIVLASGVDFDTTGGPHFPDVSTDAWYYDYVETMYNYGWINGYPDGLFRPGVGINRVEIAKMVVNAFEIDQDLSGAPHFDDVSDSDWFYGYVETAYNNGLMRGYGDGTFGPANAVTRAETAHITYNSQLVVAPIIGPSEGTLEVTLSDLTPRGTNVPYNSTSVPYLTVELTASDDSDVEVSSMTYTRLGLGDNDDFDNVWLEIDGFKVGNDKSINNDDIVELRFNPPVVVPAGQTLIADVVASAKYTCVGSCNSGGDDDKNVGHHSRMALVSADDVASSAVNVVGDFPIEGEEMEVADYEVSTLTFSSLGSNTTIDVGDNFIEIGKFRLLNGSNTNKDVELRAVTFKNDGTAELEDNLENVALYVSGEQVSAESIMDGDYLTFRLDNGVTGGYVLEDGDSKIFSLRADIVSAEASDTIIFKIDNYEDIVGVEIGTSFGVKAIDSSGNNAEDSYATLSTYTIDSGDLNVSRDPSSLGNQEYSAGSNDVVMLTARLVVDQPLLVDGVYIDVASGSETGGNGSATTLAQMNAVFDNFRMFLNDQLVDTENDFAYKSGTTAVVTNYTLNFNTTFEIAGTSILKVVANVADAAADGDKLKLEIASADFQSPEYISTGDQVADSGLLGSATGSFVTVQDSIVTVTETSGLSDGDKLVAGVDDVTFMELTMDNNDSGDVNVTSMTVGANTDVNTVHSTYGVSGSARSYENFTLAVFVDGTQQGSAKNLDETTGKATFNDLSVVIPSASQKEFVVVVDTIEASASIVTGSTTAAVADTSVTVSTANAALLTVGDVLDVVENVDPTTAVGTLTTTDRALAVTAINTTTGVITTTGTVAVHGAAVAGTAGVTTMTVDTIMANTTTVTLTDDVPNTLCVITFTTGATSDATCDGGVASVQVGGTVAADAALIRAAAATLTGYTISGATDEVIFTEAATPFIIGNVNSAVAVSTGAITDVNTTAGVATETAHTATLKHQLELDLEDVDADNVENGQVVTVTDNGVLAISTSNEVDGTAFEIVSSGTLTVSLDSTVASDILIAGQSNVEVLKVRFNAADDEVQIKDLYIENDLTASPYAGDRMDFKLYNEAGQLIQEETMAGGSLHFEMANADRIRVPKDDSTFVIVKADIRNISKANQTGAKLQLALDADNATHAGVEAVTAATGDDITKPTAGWGDAVGQVYVAYNTALSISPAATQPSMNLPSADSTEFYRFTITADSADNAEIGHVTMTVSLNGLGFSGVAALTTQRVVDGSPDVEQSFTTAASSAIADDDTSAVVKVTLTGERLAAGESRTYAVFTSLTDELGGSAENSDGVTVTLERDTAYEAPGIKSTKSTDTVAWSDESDPSHSDTTADWLNGYLLDVDTNGKRLQK